MMFKKPQNKNDRMMNSFNQAFKKNKHKNHRYQSVQLGKQTIQNIKRRNQMILGKLGQNKSSSQNQSQSSHGLNR